MAERSAYHAPRPPGRGRTPGIDLWGPAPVRGAYGHSPSSPKTSSLLVDAELPLMSVSRAPTVPLAMKTPPPTPGPSCPPMPAGPPRAEESLIHRDTWASCVQARRDLL